MCTTLPYVFDENGDLMYPNDGITECLVTGWCKRGIVSTPGFPTSVPTFPVDAYYIADSAGKSRGMFAGRNLHAGDLILAERPLLVTPTGLTDLKKLDTELYTLQQRHQSMLEDTGEFYKPLVGRMEPEFRDAFIALSNCHQFDGSGPIVGRILTNAFGSEDFMDQCMHISIIGRI